MRPISLFLACLVTLTLSGCASQGGYYWGRYEDSLYAYYKDPTKLSELSESLKESIATSERTQKAVPPGVYAEYGFFLYQQGKPSEAIPYFEKEKNKWPESTKLMDSMVQMASRAEKSHD
jgi:hypothetical protein